jgi:hypothetical protein
VSASVLEIVEVADGEIVLRRDDASEPMVRIQFSPESRAYMAGACLDIAKAMIQAGIQAAVEHEQEVAAEVEAVEHTVH